MTAEIVWAVFMMAISSYFYTITPEVPSTRFRWLWLAQCVFLGGRAWWKFSTIDGHTVAHTHAEAIDFAEAVDHARRVGVPGIMGDRRCNGWHFCSWEWARSQSATC